MGTFFGIGVLNQVLVGYKFKLTSILAPNIYYNCSIRVGGGRFCC